MTFSGKQPDNNYTLSSS